MSTPRNEYPRPAMVRDGDSFISLNGSWDFESQADGRSFLCKPEFSGRSITVPFVPESLLSGICNDDFCGAVFYRRCFELTKKQLSGRVLLHVGAADYESRVTVNGYAAGNHIGGYTPAEYDITEYVKAGENEVIISVRDDTRSPLQPSGKQSCSVKPRGCFYTRCTGIWQSVWLEFVPDLYIKNAEILPDVKNSAARFRVETSENTNHPVHVEISLCGQPVTECTAAVCGTNAVFEVRIPDPVLWDIGRGNLYDAVISCGEDSVRTYFGMRSVEISGNRLLLNGRPVFMRLVLDQGYYPDGIYTAPDANSFRRDIELAMSAGFNGARMHMKIFEPGFIAAADKAGYLLWGEYPNWGLDISRPEAAEAMLPEWCAAVKRDISHPSIIGWCPFNEAFPGEKELPGAVYAVTRQLDPTRPVIEVSGYIHTGEGDIYDVHDYEQNPSEFAAHYAGLSGNGGSVYVNSFSWGNGGNKPYDGKKPYFVSEMGGAFFDMDAEHENSEQESGGSWGYGNAPASGGEYVSRFTKLCGALLDNPGVCGLCWTQFTDVEQEMNGIFSYDRRAKFDVSALRAAISRPAAIEKE